MNFIDFTFLKLFHFVFFIRREKDSAKWAAFLYLSSYFALCIISFVSLIGILYDNKFCQYIKSDTTFFWMTAFILSPIILSFRYYRFVSITSIETSYSTMDKNKRIIIDIGIYTLMIIIPILTFILYRLYINGHLN